MAKLLGMERSGPRIDKYWRHTGQHGQDAITVETVQDVQPIIRNVKNKSEQPKSKYARHVASIPSTIVDEVCRVESRKRNSKPSEVYKELIGNKTRWAKATWELLSKGRDYRKLQAKNYAS